MKSSMGHAPRLHARFLASLIVLCVGSAVFAAPPDGARTEAESRTDVVRRDWPASAHALAFVAWILLCAFFFAKLEIQIEGAHGWAANLPTWRIEKHRLLDLFWGGRPMTGYHAWAFSFMALVFHLALFVSGAPTIRHELRILGGLAIFWIAEDFLWFVLNPAYGLSRFTRHDIPWHKNWIGPVPTDYVSFTILGCGLLAFSFVR